MADSHKIHLASKHVSVMTKINVQCKFLVNRCVGCSATWIDEATEMEVCDDERREVIGSNDGPDL